MCDTTIGPKVEKGELSVEVYKAWQANPNIDVGYMEERRRVFGQKRLPSRLMLECYPAELLTTAEVGRTIGILWYVPLQHNCSQRRPLMWVRSGHLEPRVSTTCNTQDLDDFVAQARKRGDQIVLLARGGRTGNNTQPVKPPVSGYALEERSTAAELRSIVDGGLAMRLSEHVSVVAQGAAGSKAKRVKERIFSVPRMELDFSSVLPKVDLVIHHGEFCFAYCRFHRLS